MAQVTVALGRLLTLTDFELFDFDYQFDDPVFKKELEQHIIDYFYDHEIGSETPDMFKRRFKARFLRNIDYYNKMYNTTLLQYNPLINSKMSEALNQLATSTGSSVTDQDTTSTTDTTSAATGTQSGTTNTDGTQTGTNNTTGTQNGTTDTTGNQKASDYPQQPIGAGNYLAAEEDTTTTSVVDMNTTSNNTVNMANSSDTVSNMETASDSTDNTTSTASTDVSVSTTGQTDTSYSKTIEGLTGTTYQELIRQERDNLMRIPIMLCNELKPCFILIY